MLEETFSRLEGFIPLERTLIVTGEELQEKILFAMPSLKEDNLLLEPQGKNTCLAIGLAAAHVGREDPKAVMVVLSSDHQIFPPQRLVEILQAAADHAQKEDCLFTMLSPSIGSRSSRRNPPSWRPRSITMTANTSGTPASSCGRSRLSWRP